jgi:putative FmdB family regulatory protein
MRVGGAITLSKSRGGLSVWLCTLVSPETSLRQQLYVSEFLMPIYEYECSTCGRFEVIQKFSDKPLKQCPSCKEKGKTSSVTKAVSASAFHLKGSGWYKTDYSSGNTGSTGASSSSKKDAGGESSGKGEVEKAPVKSACGTGCGCH